MATPFRLRMEVASRDSLCRDGSGSSRPKAHRRTSSPKLNGAMVEALADPAVRKRFADLGLDVAPREPEQTPEGLATFQKAEIEKWWPIIKAAGIGAQAL